MDFDSDLSSVWLVLFLTILVHGAFLRRLAQGFVDPIVYTAIGTTAAVTMAFALTGASLELLRVVLCVATFWLGVGLAWPKRSLRSSTLQSGPLAQQHFVRIVAISTLMFVAANLLLFATSGAPVFSENPSLSKVETYTGGLGIVRRINWGLGNFVIVALTYLLFTSRPRWSIWAYVMFVGISALSGSKSALVPLLFAFALLRNRQDVRQRARSWPRALDWLLPVLVCGALGVSLGVLLLENGDTGGALLAFLRRMLYASDVLIYWEMPEVRHFFRSMDLFDYVYNVLNPVLGGLRLVDYQQALGSDMVQISLGVGDEVSESLGPNLPFYVKGEMFFGPAQYLYCLAIGGAIGWVRACFVAASPGRPMLICVLATLVLLSPGLSIDDTLALQGATDLFVFLGLAWLLASAWPLTSPASATTSNVHDV